MPSLTGNETTGKAGIELETRTCKPNPFKYMIDPQVASAPFTLHVDEDKCIGCGVCMRQCPGSSIILVPRDKPSARQAPACEFNCPAGTHVREYLRLITEGASFDKAWESLTGMNPFPAVTGRVCPHPCEGACNRSQLDAPLNINCIERTLGDYGIENNLSFAQPAGKMEEKVAVVGSGPSGLSCAYQLARLGYQVTVFESGDKPGGMLRYAIPAYRLPEAVVENEISRITDLGVEIKLGTRVGKDISLDELKKSFKAVYIAIGAQAGTAMGVKGEDAHVISGLAFLRSLREAKPLKAGKKVIVVGGGNTAIDAARSARRLGAEVLVVYRRTAAEMPAHESEVRAAREEGVKIEFLCAPVGISGNSKNKTVTLQRMELSSPDASGRPRPVPVEGSEFDLECTTVIAAVGQDIEASGFENIPRSSKWFNAGLLGQSEDKAVFVGGDASRGPGLVAEAIGDGRKAAVGIDAFIRGVSASLPELSEISFKGIPLDRTHIYKQIEGIKRSDTKMLPAANRLAAPEAEEALPFSKIQTMIESRRCLGCGTYKAQFAGLPEYFGKICLACHVCETICPQGASLMPNFYRVDEGRWATDYDFPVDSRDGLPNPLRLMKPVPFKEIENRITDVERVIYTRRSVRVFKQDPVPREIIERVLEAGRFAPTAGNCIGYKAVVITDRKLMDKLSDATNAFLKIPADIYMSKHPIRRMIKTFLTLVKPNSFDQRPMAAISGLSRPRVGYENVDVFFDAPCAILLLPHALHVSDKEVALGIIGQNMVLTAHALGLGTCYVGLVAQTLNQNPLMKLNLKLRKELGMQWPYNKAGIFILLGYPAVKIDGAVPREFPQVLWR